MPFETANFLIISKAAWLKYGRYPSKFPSLCKRLSWLPPLKTIGEELAYLQGALATGLATPPLLWKQTAALTSSLGSRLSSSLNAVPTRLLTWGGSSPALSGYSLGILPVSSWGTEKAPCEGPEGEKGSHPPRPQRKAQFSPPLAGRFSSAPQLSEAVFPEGVSPSSLVPRFSPFFVLRWPLNPESLKNTLSVSEDLQVKAVFFRSGKPRSPQSSPAQQNNTLSQLQHPALMSSSKQVFRKSTLFQIPNVYTCTISPKYTPPKPHHPKYKTLH